jgi:hypothetical protein
VNEIGTKVGGPISQHTTWKNGKKS